MNDQFFVAQGDTLVGWRASCIPSLYADAALPSTRALVRICGGRSSAAGIALLRGAAAGPRGHSRAGPGFASASGREEAPCDYAAAGYPSSGVGTGGRGCEFCGRDRPPFPGPGPWEDPARRRLVLGIIEVSACCRAKLP